MGADETKEYLDRRKNGTLNARGRRGEPNYSETGSGGRFSSERPLSGLEEAAARARGKTAEQWTKLTAAVNKRTTLEDI